MHVPKEWEIRLATAKVEKYAVDESGDTVEVIERPGGGFSLVLADGQRSGRAAKLISTIATRKIVSLLADGVRDGAAARAAHDYLRVIRQGQVSAEVIILSVDLDSDTIVISRNSHCPVLVVRRAGDGTLPIEWLDQPSEPIGVQARTKPVIAEFALADVALVVLFSDGIWHAGVRRGLNLDVEALVREYQATAPARPEELADALLSRALELDEGRPGDDISVAVVTVEPEAGPNGVRRMSMRFPI